MMWFDEIMDDCKKALKIASDNKVIFVPIIVKAVVNIVLLLILGIGTVFFFVANRIQFSRSTPSIEFVITVVVGVILVYMIYLIIRAIFEVGSISMYKAAIEGIKPNSKHFFDGVKKYFFRVFGTTFIVQLLIFIFLLPLIILFLLYAVTLGLLTGGWAITLISILIGVYLSAWIIAVVEDNVGGFKGIGASMRLGKKYFWGLFILSLSGILIGRYIAVAFGGLITLAVGWFLAGVIIAYFKVVVYLIYKRKKEELYS